MLRILIVIACLLAMGCASINGQPPALNLDILKADFQAASDNFKAAGLTGESQCLADAVAKLGGTTQSYKVVGIFSAASVAYIGYDQLQSSLAQGPNALSPACQQVVGKVILAGASQGAKRFGL